MLRVVRWRLRSLMVVVALSAMAVWAGMHWSDWRESFHQWRVNRPIWRQLDRTIPLRFPKGVPLDQLLGHINQRTKGGAWPAGLTIYVDPIGIEDANMTLDSVVTIDTQSLPLKDALRSALKPLGLTLYVRDGLAVVTDEASVP